VDKTPQIQHPSDRESDFKKRRKGKVSEKLPIVCSWSAYINALARQYENMNSLQSKEKSA
jgi:hypothetical protein